MTGRTFAIGARYMNGPEFVFRVAQFFTESLNIYQVCFVGSGPDEWSSKERSIIVLEIAPFPCLDKICPGQRVKYVLRWILAGIRVFCGVLFQIIVRCFFCI